MSEKTLKFDKIRVNKKESLDKPYQDLKKSTLSRI